MAIGCFGLCAILFVMTYLIVRYVLSMLEIECGVSYKSDGNSDNKNEEKDELETTNYNKNDNEGENKTSESKLTNKYFRRFQYKKNKIIADEKTKKKSEKSFIYFYSVLMMALFHSISTFSNSYIIEVSKIKCFIVF